MFIKKKKYAPIAFIVQVNIIQYLKYFDKSQEHGKENVMNS